MIVPIESESAESAVYFLDKLSLKVCHSREGGGGNATIMLPLRGNRANIIRPYIIPPNAAIVALFAASIVPSNRNEAEFTCPPPPNFIAISCTGA